MRRLVRALLCVAALAVLPAKAQVSAPNYSNNQGWHVGGVLEVLDGGTLRLSTGTKTAAATSGAATLNKLAGVITSESLSTAAGASYTLTLTDSQIAAADQVFASVALGTATTGTPTVTTVKPSAGSVVIIVQNVSAAAALNGTIKVSYAVVKN